MKLGPVTKRDKRNKVTSKEVDDYVISPPRLKLTLPWLGASHQEVSTRVRQGEELN